MGTSPFSPKFHSLPSSCSVWPEVLSAIQRESTTGNFPGHRGKEDGEGMVSDLSELALIPGCGSHRDHQDTKTRAG